MVSMSDYLCILPETNKESKKTLVHLKIYQVAKDKRKEKSNYIVTCTIS